LSSVASANDYYAQLFACFLKECNRIRKFALRAGLLYVAPVAVEAQKALQLDMVPSADAELDPDVTLEGAIAAISSTIEEREEEDDIALETPTDESRAQVYSIPTESNLVPPDSARALPFRPITPPSSRPVSPLADLTRAEYRRCEQAGVQFKPMFQTLTDLVGLNLMTLPIGHRNSLLTAVGNLKTCL